MLTYLHAKSVKNCKISSQRMGEHQTFFVPMYRGESEDHPEGMLYLIGKNAELYQVVQFTSATFPNTNHSRFPLPAVSPGVAIMRYPVEKVKRMPAAYIF